MAALTASRVVLIPKGSIKRGTFPLGFGSAPGKVFENGMAVMDTANLGAVWGASVSTTLKPIGKFTGGYDNSAGAATVPIGVDLSREHTIEWWDQTGGAITVAANLFQTVYIASDHEVTLTSTGASAYGIIWAVNPPGYPSAVGVEPLY